ncbi:hypothetical protein JX265_013306 [Neoarthrinium moseri]|uniref:Mitochondrial transcription factor 1 n=1 Tax=Neoarthrinium moseri TaxID=1658444 RepID=A0A9P9W8T5_9PEZI|nr:hypothetical protein JX266_010421 [Neoarthrinium moseri]KAI1850826.1 hypothetical protein JX265_013306 [Neoarthrinium moseri]
MRPTRVTPLRMPSLLRPCLRNVRPRLIIRRGAATERLEPRLLQATSPLAEHLRDLNFWEAREARHSPQTAAPRPRLGGRTAQRSKERLTGDKARVNIVSEKLCDDTISYLAKSLERHKGCDLVDVYPGAGLWSRKLNEFLEPRTHILMEPDTKLYRPFLQPLLDSPEATLVPKSGIVWKELDAVLTPEFLPHQKLVDRKSEEANQRNDTLLVTCNLAFYPKKKFVGFDSVALLVLHQFVDSIKSSGLFQKYGQVRMLVWVRREDKAGILPRVMQRRRRQANETELLCDWVHEVVGYDGRDSSVFARDSTIDRASALATLKRMQEAGITTPEGRMSEALKTAMADLEQNRPVVPGSVPSSIERAYSSLLESPLSADIKVGTEEFNKRQKSQWRFNGDVRRFQFIHDLQKMIDDATAMREAGRPAEECEALEARFDDLLSRTTQVNASDFGTAKDNLHIWRQPEPVMHWDRRAIEPLIASPQEFYPNVECCLLDIQPKPINRIMRHMGPGSAHNGEAAELIMRLLWGTPTQPIDRALDAVWPGAADYIIPRCPSFRDPAQGGVNVKTKHAQLSVRLLNPTQWEELLHHWSEWPFQPTFPELVSRSQDDGDSDYDTSSGGTANY